MKVRVEIAYKAGVLDPEAQAIGRALGDLGFASLKHVRKIKVMELELDTDSAREAEAEADAMCRRLLANPVIETFKVSSAQ